MGPLVTNTFNGEGLKQCFFPSFVIIGYLSLCNLWVFLIFYNSLIITNCGSMMHIESSYVLQNNPTKLEVFKFLKWLCPISVCFLIAQGSILFLFYTFQLTDHSFLFGKTSDQALCIFYLKVHLKQSQTMKNCKYSTFSPPKLFDSKLLA